MKITKFKPILLLLLLCISSIPLIQLLPPTVNAQLPDMTDWVTHQLGSTEVPEVLETDWSQFWTLFNFYSEWDLECDTGSGWFSCKEALEIQRDYKYVVGDFSENVSISNANRVKITMIFDAPYTGNYRLTFAVKENAKNYTTVSDWQIEIEYEQYSIVFDFSDMQGISGMTYNHGTTEYEGEDWFYWRCRRDNVPEGTHVVLDPYIGSATGGGSYWSMAGRITGSYWTMPEDGYVYEIKSYLYITSTAGATIAGIYTWPDLDFVGTSDQTVGSQTGSFWQTYTCSSPIALTSGQAYLIVNWASGAGYSTYYNGATSNGVRQDEHTSYFSWPDPFVDTYQTNGQVAIYANYLTEPAPTSAVIDDMDDTNNVYTMKKYYSFVGVVDNEAGAVYIGDIYLRGLDSGSGTVFEVRGTDLEGTPSYSIQTGSSIIDLDTGSCNWDTDGDIGTITFEIRFEWDCTQYTDMGISMIAYDTSGYNEGWNVMQTSYFNVVSRLTTSGLASDISATGYGGTAVISGTVYYATTSTGDTSSSSYPPDAQFTSVAIHNSGHSSQGTDSSIVNGAFSVSITTPSSEGTYTYHVYLNMLADYTDADAPDGDTVSIIVNQIILQYTFDNQTSTTIAYDTSDIANNGAITGATRSYSGYYGMGMSFDGTDYITTPDDSTLDFDSTVVMSSWIYPTSITESVIFDKPDSWGMLLLADGGISVMVNNNYYNTTSGLITASSWFHVVGIYDGSNVKVYINGVSKLSTSYSSAITPSAFDLIIGHEFIGRLDELQISEDSTLTYNDLDDTIATYPYCYDVELDAGDLIVSGIVYNFTGVYVQESSTYPMTYVRWNFTDGFEQMGIAYNITSTTYTLYGDTEEVITFLSRAYSTTGTNGHVLQARIRIEDIAYSSADVDLDLYCETATANNSRTFSDYFSIYGIGGITTVTLVGDGAQIAGGSFFDVMATNSSATASGSSARVEYTVLNFQHAHFLMHQYQGAAWDSDHWDCPTIHSDTGYVEYGIDYLDDENWVTGWSVRIKQVSGMANATGAYVLLNCTWYNNGTIIKSDSIYAMYEAYTSSDLTTQYSLYIDLWISDLEQSSTVAGHVSAQYYGMESTGWWLWSSYGPVGALSTSTTFYETLYGYDASVATASNFEFFKVWVEIAKTADDTGCDSHVWAAEHEIAQINNLPSGVPLYGIDSPVYMPTTTPDMPLGYFASLGNILSEKLDQIYYALSSTVTTVASITSDTINEVAAGFGLSGFLVQVSDFITDISFFFVDSVTYITDFLVQIFEVFTGVAGFLIEQFGNVVGIFFTNENSIASIMVGIIDGTYGLDTGFGDILSLFDDLGPAFWTNFIPLIMIVYWLDSIDQRARRLGAGWTGIFLGDIQSIMSIFSYITDIAWRVVNTVIDMMMRFMSYFI